MRNKPGEKEFRQFVGVERAAAGDSREVTFIISSQSVDRMGDTISVDGWDWKAWEANPVVLWAHDQRSLPVAKGVKIWRDGAVIKATAEFPTADVHPFGAQVYELLKFGALNACSVGFNPLEWSWVEDKDRPYGIDFKRQELLEFSVVPVPANADALVTAKAAGVATELVDAWARDWSATIKQNLTVATTPPLRHKFMPAIGRRMSYR